MPAIRGMALCFLYARRRREARRRLDVVSLAANVEAGARQIGADVSDARLESPFLAMRERLRLAIDDHRNLGVGEHALCLAADQEAAETAPPVRGHEDQIALVFFSG